MVSKQVGLSNEKVDSCEVTLWFPLQGGADVSRISKRSRCKSIEGFFDLKTNLNNWAVVCQPLLNLAISWTYNN